ncbi:MAG: endolytic transglycosylase MltG [Colwellia sp.]
MIKKLIIGTFLAFVFIIITCFIILNKQLSKELTLNKTSFITVTKGSTISSFSALLVNKGWIESRFWLRNYGRFNPDKASIKVGTYQVVLGTTVYELLAQIVAGNEHQFSITFIEGTTFRQWLALLTTQKQIKQTINGKSIAEVVNVLAINHDNPEGLFFPDTYAFTAGTTDIALLKRAYKQMQNHIQVLWQTRAVNLPYQSPYQALIMASIIEKETSYLPEQPLIASVFINRLDKKMRLQTDPTVIYGLGEKYQGDITRAHLREKTPYNTYRINGLPPTPIAMAGLSSLNAALNPASSRYLYFVSQGNGQHVFSQTLTEHNLAVKSYLNKQKRLKDKN